MTSEVLRLPSFLIFKGKVTQTLDNTKTDDVAGNECRKVVRLLLGEGQMEGLGGWKITEMKHQEWAEDVAQW